MPNRYSGDLRIAVSYRDATDNYTVQIFKDGRRVFNEIINPPQYTSYARDSKRAFDTIAQAALAFADNDDNNIGEAAEYSENDFVVRSTPWSRTDRDKKRQKRR